MNARGLVCLVAAAALLASAGVVCAYNETGTITTFGESSGNTVGAYSTIVGYAAGNGNSSTGYRNTFIGAYAGNINTSGTRNTFIGYDAGYANSNGAYNTYLGNNAGFSNSSGSSNTFVGYQAGFNNSGSYNVFLGHLAGYNAAGSNKLYIDNCYSGTCTWPPFIYGEFDNRILQVDGSLGIGTTPVRQLHLFGDNAVFRMDRTADTAAFMLVRVGSAFAFTMKTFVVGTNASGINQGEFVINDLGAEVSGPGTRRMTITNNGAVEFTGIVSAPQVIETSSLAFKTNVRTYENALETVKRLRGVHFDWKESGKPSVGLIAEEVEGVVPEVVAHGGNGGAATGVNYSGLVGVLVEAVKEQQKTISALSEKVSELEKMLK
jgi:hypothetical protein